MFEGVKGFYLTYWQAC